MIKRIVLLIAVLIVSANAQDYRLEPVAEGLYRFESGSYRSMVWVTDEGIAVLDPLSTEAATWLKKELADRFPQKVRYLVYSHNHFDHSYGGEVFEQPEVTLVGHELAHRALKNTNARTPLPEIVFSDRLTIHMGGEVLELRYHGANNGEGSVSFLFPGQKLLYVVDWIVVGRLPYQDFQGYDIDGSIRSTEEVLELEWDTFVGGHADVGDRQGVERYLRYMTELRQAVLDGMLEGKSLADLQQDIKMESYADLKMHDQWLHGNIKGMYEQLRDKHYLLNRP